jgi:hypothetical protein
VYSLLFLSQTAQRGLLNYCKNGFLPFYGLRKAKEMKFSNHVRPTPVGSSVLIGEWRQQITAMADSGKY